MIIHNTIPWAYPLAGSHMRLTTLSRVSTPPSLRAFVTDLAPCSLVANSRRPSSKWSRVILLCFSDPCSRTESNMECQRLSVPLEGLGRTVLNAVGSPLVFRHLTKYREPVVEKFIDNPVLRISFKVFEGVLRICGFKRMNKN